MKKGTKVEIQGIMIAVMVGLTVYVAHAHFTTRDEPLKAFAEDLKGEQKHIQVQLKDIRDNQDSVQSKLVMDVQGLRSELNEMKNAKPAIQPVEIIGAVKMHMTDYARAKKVMPEAPGPMLKRAQEMSR